MKAPIYDRKWYWPVMYACWIITFICWVYIITANLIMHSRLKKSNDRLNDLIEQL